MNKKKVLVTGSEGFIGKHLVSELKKRDFTVFRFDIKNGDDINDFQKLKDKIKKSDVTFHLAGVLGTHELIEDSINAVNINVLGTLNVLEAVKKFKRDLVIIGKPNVWLNTYSITKEASEKFTQLYVKEFGVRAWIVKWFNVFGPGQHYGIPQKLAPTAIVKALRNEPIQVFGNGRQTVDHIYVADAVNAAIDVYKCEKAIGIPVEVGLGREMKVVDFVRLVIKYIGSKSKIKFIPMRRGEVENTMLRANIEFLSKVVGFKPKFSVEEGLKLTIPYYQKLINNLE
jgi:UDP-glucose 4-epimerase